MSKTTHIYIQAVITIMQYLIPAFLLTQATAEQRNAVTLSLAVLQGVFAVGNQQTSLVGKQEPEIK